MVQMIEQEIVGARRDEKATEAATNFVKRLSWRWRVERLGRQERRPPSYLDPYFFWCYLKPGGGTQISENPRLGDARKGNLIKFLSLSPAVGLHARTKYTWCLTTVSTWSERKVELARCGKYCRPPPQNFLVRK